MFSPPDYKYVLLLVQSYEQCCLDGYEGRAVDFKIAPGGRRAATKTGTIVVQEARDIFVAVVWSIAYRSGDGVGRWAPYS